MWGFLHILISWMGPKWETWCEMTHLKQMILIHQKEKSGSTLVWLVFCGWNKAFCSQAARGGRVHFSLHFQVTVYHWEKTGQELKQEQGKNHGGKLLLACFPLACAQLLSSLVLDHVTRGGTTHIGLGLPTSFNNQDDLPIDMATGDPRLKLPLPRWLLVELSWQKKRTRIRLLPSIPSMVLVRTDVGRGCGSIVCLEDME